MVTGAGKRRRTTKPATETAATTNKRRIRKPNGQQKRHKHKNKHLTQRLFTAVSTATSSALSFLTQNDLHLLPSQTLTLESLLSSTSFSLSSLLSLLPNDPLKNPSFSKNAPPPPPIPCWFHRFISAASAENDPRWLDAFRMSKPSFTLLLRLLAPSLHESLPSLPPNYTLAAALYRLAHAASYKSISRRFAMDSSEACRAFYVVCEVVNDKLGHFFEFRTDMGRIVVGFGWTSFPNCCGVLGLERFPVDSALLGENGALMVQALVDSEGRFLDVSAGWPSTMRPETIFRQTKLFSGVEESMELLNGPSYELSDGNPIPQYILGDSCFPLLPWLLTPFIRSNEEDSFNSAEYTFNSAHIRAMELVHTAFGRVRSLWQLLSRQWKEECLEYLPFVIVTGCLLHNFLIKCGEKLPEENVGWTNEQELPVFEGDPNEGGQRIREALALHLSRETKPLSSPSSSRPLGISDGDPVSTQLLCNGGFPSQLLSSKAAN